MKRNCLLILIGLIDTLLTMHVSAQQSFVEDVLSPNAMDLGRYGDIPMNYLRVVQMSPFPYLKQNNEM